MGHDLVHPTKMFQAASSATLRRQTDISYKLFRQLLTVDKDVKPQNFGVHTSWRKARGRDTWQQVLSMATLLGVRHQEEEEEAA